MNVVGSFTMLYFLIKKGFLFLSDFYTVYAKLPFLIQEFILLVFLICGLPKIFNFLDFIKIKWHAWKNSL